MECCAPRSFGLAPIDPKHARENRLIRLEETEATTAPTQHFIDIYPGKDASQSAHAIQASFTLGGGADRVYEYAYDYRTRRVLRDESGAPGGASTDVVFSGGTSVQEGIIRKELEGII